ncbi:MAG: NRDE family protein [Lysobacterales bacterium]|jgi:uncharacterized protein with NRDE domain|nr:MAG: NRDE family protein [Xanthomonadales bacterium]
MCLLVLAWLSHPRYRLVVAGNRDEFHERPTAALSWWNDDPRILAGRDLRAGGTWLGLSRTGRFGTVTNVRDAEVPSPGSLSRGTLVPDFLRDASAPVTHLERLAEAAAGHAGYNLLVGDAHSLAYHSNTRPAERRRLDPGVYGLSNHRLDEPWPKLTRTRERFAVALESLDPSPDEFFDVLADRIPAATTEPAEVPLPPGLHQALTAPFVVHERYGTRCSTVVLVEHEGRTAVFERRYDPGGAQTGASRHEFEATP